MSHTISETEMMIFGDFVRFRYWEMDKVNWPERYEMYLEWMDGRYPNSRRLSFEEFFTQLKIKIENSEDQISTYTEWRVFRARLQRMNDGMSGYINVF